MRYILKDFTSLSTQELFEIYKLRSDIFVVEQNCAYQDVDDKDLSSFHVMLFSDHQLAGYSRLLPPGTSYQEPSIGRVAVKREFRTQGLGKSLMKHSIKQTLELYNNQAIVISAQAYLLKFYTDLGFTKEGEEYLEDDIPHIKMRYKVH
ncbi:GNAT family N-acetyltransferase [Sphingobacteriaceae bacterium]|nr:GNAT family N-acetyltransferase [Sphingobacteriaceae bacterium]